MVYSLNNSALQLYLYHSKESRRPGTRLLGSPSPPQALRDRPATPGSSSLFKGPIAHFLFLMVKGDDLRVNASSWF